MRLRWPPREPIPIPHRLYSGGGLFSAMDFRLSQPRWWLARKQYHRYALVTWRHPDWWLQFWWDRIEYPFWELLIRWGFWDITEGGLYREGWVCFGYQRLW